MINIICIGKIKESYLKEGIADYTKRISKYFENINSKKLFVTTEGFKISKFVVMPLVEIPLILILLLIILFKPIEKRIDFKEFVYPNKKGKE